MDQQPAVLPTETVNNQQPPRKPLLSKKMIFIACGGFLLVAGLVILVFMYFSNSDEVSQSTDQLSTAERHVYDGNNAVSDQDKLKAYNQAKELFYDEGNYQRVAAVYEAAYEKADTTSKYYAYFLYYLADAYYRNGQVAQAVTIQAKFVKSYENPNYIRPVPEKSAKNQLDNFKQVLKTSKNSDFQIKVSDQVTPSEE